MYKLAYLFFIVKSCDSMIISPLEERLVFESLPLIPCKGKRKREKKEGDISL